MTRIRGAGRGERPAARRGEQGQIGMVLLAMVFALMVGGVYIVTYGAEQEVSAQSRAAADAAALAGATVGVDEIVGRLVAREIDFALSCGLGRGRAADFAARNGARLTDYCFGPDGTVRVTVEVARGSSGDQESERAAARIALPSCTETTPTPTPTPTATSAPAPEVERSCSIPGLGRIRLGPRLDVARIREALQPRLVPPG
jgi:hypothetical protein